MFKLNVRKCLINETLIGEWISRSHLTVSVHAKIESLGLKITCLEYTVSALPDPTRGLSWT